MIVGVLVAITLSNFQRPTFGSSGSNIVLSMLIYPNSRVCINPVQVRRDRYLDSFHGADVIFHYHNANRWKDWLEILESN